MGASAFYDVRQPDAAYIKRAGLYHSNYQSSTSVLAAICLANRVGEKDIYFVSVTKTSNANFKKFGMIPSYGYISHSFT
jgi:hypothetical protein